MSNQPSHGQTFLSAPITEGEHVADMQAIGRLRELADEYAGTEVGDLYQAQWEAAVSQFEGENIVEEIG